MRQFVVNSWRSAAVMGRRGSDSLLSLVLPPVCRLCETPVSASDFCHRCEAALRVGESAMREACPRCGTPRPSVDRQPSVDRRPSVDRQHSVDRRPDATEVSADRPDKSAPNTPALEKKSASVRCATCKQREFDFAEVLSLWPYQEVVRDAVVAAKRASQIPLGDALGRRLGERVAARFDNSAEEGGCPDLVTFVPSHWTRRLARGGNGVEILARAVSRRLNRPCHPAVAVTRRIAKQAWLDDAEREKNVRGAFRLKRSYALTDARGVTGKHILLIDDVLTTGATAHEVAGVLRAGGARRVTLAVVARALRT